MSRAGGVLAWAIQTVSGRKGDSAAQRDYFRLEDQAGKLMDQLAREPRPAERARMLDELADAEHQMGEIHRQAFGADPNPHERGRDLADSIRFSAQLAGFVAATEHALAGTRPGTAHGNYPDGICPGMREIGAELAYVADRYQRADILDRLWEAVHGHVGGQAAEALVALARTEREAAKHGGSR